MTFAATQRSNIRFGIGSTSVRLLLREARVQCSDPAVRHVDRSVLVGSRAAWPKRAPRAARLRRRSQWGASRPAPPVRLAAQRARPLSRPQRAGVSGARGQAARWSRRVPWHARATARRRLMEPGTAPVRSPCHSGRALELIRLLKSRDGWRRRLDAERPHPRALVRRNPLRRA